MSIILDISDLMSSLFSDDYTPCDVEITENGEVLPAIEGPEEKARLLRSMGYDPCSDRLVKREIEHMNAHPRQLASHLISVGIVDHVDGWDICQYVKKNFVDSALKVVIKETGTQKGDEGHRIAQEYRVKTKKIEAMVRAGRIDPRVAHVLYKDFDEDSRAYESMVARFDSTFGDQAWADMIGAMRAMLFSMIIEAGDLLGVKTREYDFQGIARAMHAIVFQCADALLLCSEYDTDKTANTRNAPTLQYRKFVYEYRRRAVGKIVRYIESIHEDD